MSCRSLDNAYWNIKYLIACNVQLQKPFTYRYKTANVYSIISNSFPCIISVMLTKIPTLFSITCFSPLWAKGRNMKTKHSRFDSLYVNPYSETQNSDNTKWFDVCCIDFVCQKHLRGYYTSYPKISMFFALSEKYLEKWYMHLIVNCQRNSKISSKFT